MNENRTSNPSVTATIAARLRSPYIPDTGTCKIAADLLEAYALKDVEIERLRRIADLVYNDYRKEAWEEAHAYFTGTEIAAGAADEPSEHASKGIKSQYAVERISVCRACNDPSCTGHPCDYAL